MIQSLFVTTDLSPHFLAALTAAGITYQPVDGGLEITGSPDALWQVVSAARESEAEAEDAILDLILDVLLVVTVALPVVMIYFFV